MSKKEFVELFGVLLFNTNLGVEKLALEDNDEILCIYYSNGNTKNISIAYDNNYGIILDVLKNFKP